MIVVDVFEQIVTRVSAKVMPILQESEPSISIVKYHYGHPLEIIETLMQEDKSQTKRFEKYPLIGLFQDFPEKVSEKQSVGIEKEVRLHLIIAKSTNQNYKAKDRYTNNFKPFLYPIYEELKKQIHFDKNFLTRSENHITHEKWDRLYWGKNGLFGNDGNIFNDYIDCIEIKNLTLKVNPIC